MLQDTLEQLALEEIDQSNAVLFIHYDPDTKMIYLAGKVRYCTCTPYPVSQCVLSKNIHTHAMMVIGNSEREGDLGIGIF